MSSLGEIVICILHPTKAVIALKSYWECLLCEAVEQHVNRIYTATVAETGKNSLV